MKTSLAFGLEYRFSLFSVMVPCSTCSIPLLCSCQLLSINRVKINLSSGIAKKRVLIVLYVVKMKIRFCREVISRKHFRQYMQIMIWIVV